MTAINIFLQKTRGIIMTDSLFIDLRTGEPVEMMDKCRMVRDAGMAVAVRGDFRVPEILAEELPDLFGNIDQLVADDGEAVRNVYDRFVRTFDGPVVNADVEIMIVGWSPQKDRPIGFYVLRRGGWKFGKIGADGLAGPLPDGRELARLRKLGIEPGRHWNMETFDPIRHGIPYMEAQRRMDVSHEGNRQSRPCRRGLDPAYRDHPRGHDAARRPRVGRRPRPVGEPRSVRSSRKAVSEIGLVSDPFTREVSLIVDDEVA